jgi:uncharacterized protein (TIGR00251 family)
MWYQCNEDNVTLDLYIQPGAKQTEITGFHGDALKIRLNAPPIEGRANDALCKFIAQLFKVPVRQVTLKRGEKSRHKTLIVTGSSVNPEDFS